MNLSATITIYAGGPGSGCNPDKGKCGRPHKGGSKKRKENSVSKVLKDYEQMGENIYSRFYRVGRPMSPAPLTSKERNYIERLKDMGCDPEIKQCYMNAQKLMLYDRAGKLKYHEGYIETHGVPIHHAWVSINGKVVDVTMEALQETQGALYKEHKDYWGVTIDQEDVMKFLIEHETYAPLTETKKYNLKYLGPLRKGKK